LAHLEWWRAYSHFVRPHEALRVALVQPRERGGKLLAQRYRQRTPAMAAGRTKRRWNEVGGRRVALRYVYEVGSQRGSSPTDPEEGVHHFSKVMDSSTRAVSDVSSYLFPNRTGPFQGIRLSGSAIRPPWSGAASTATQVLTFCLTLDPFPVS
jgi:hypothetical protein